MSVRESVRKPTEEKFLVLQASEKLLEYSYIILSNKKIFPDKYPPAPKDPKLRSQWIIKCRQRDSAKEMMMQIRRLSVAINNKLHAANGIYIKTANQVKMRIKFEKEALEYTYCIQGMLQNIANSYHIELRRVTYWTNLNKTLQVKLKAWIKSEISKCKMLYDSGRVSAVCSDSWFQDLIADIM